jgi:hypothetical protein
MIKKSLDQGYRGINKLSMKLFISIIFDIYLTSFKLVGYRDIFIFDGGNKRLRNVTNLYCLCQISQRRS